MRKIRIRFKKINIDWKSLAEYILLIISSSVILITILIALPLTEKVSDVFSFNLNLTQDYWSKDYTLEINEDAENSDVEKTRSILFRRLNKYGVEEASVYRHNDELKVKVKTSLDQTYVEELIRNPYRYSIVTRKEDVDFDDEEDMLAQYLPENYNETEFGAETFRNIYVTKLPDSGGTKSYFGIAKVWANRTNDFNNFLEENVDQFIGIQVDGFVTPMYISDTTVFAIPLGGDEQNVEVIDLLYNTGNIPISYSFQEGEPSETISIDINHIEISLAMLVIIIAFYTYLFFTNTFSKDLITLGIFSTLLTISLLLTLLKIGYKPINPYLLLTQGVFAIILTKILITNIEYKYIIVGSISVITTIFSLLGIGYVRILSTSLISLSIIILLSVLFSGFYIDKISKYFKK